MVTVLRQIFLFFIVFLLPHNRYGVSQTLDVKQVDSILQAHKDSLAGWESGDFMIRLVETAEGRPLSGEKNTIVQDGELAILEREILVRAVFDYSTNVALLIRQENLEQHFFKANGDEYFGDGYPAIDRRLSGVVFAGDTRIARADGYRPAKIPKDAVLAEVLSSFGFIDLRVAGMMPVKPSKMYADLDGFASLFLSPDRATLITEVGNHTNRVLFTIKPTDRDGVSRFVELDIDCNKLVPVRLVGSVSGKTPLSPRNVHIDERVTWRELNGISVPIAIAGRANIGRMIQRRRFVFVNERSLKVHWFSLNEDIDEKFFDPNNIMDVGRMTELVSPEHQDATSLLEEVDSEEDGKQD